MLITAPFENKKAFPNPGNALVNSLDNSVGLAGWQLLKAVLPGWGAGYDHMMVVMGAGLN
jgi:hypothetical protein